MAEDVFEIVGTVVGGAFNVEAVVAEGGFAVVYRAYHGAFRAPVALKCLKVPAVGRSDQTEFLERFREEGEVMFRLSLSIPAVVRPLHVDAFETARGIFVPYMAMEWLDGEPLDVLIARRSSEGLPPMSPKRVTRMLAPVARALERAHNFPGPNGPISIVHRDLKPDNIVLGNINGEEVVKILDFGIAKVKSVASQVVGRLSQEGIDGSVPFTPGYAAPEQWFPKRYGQTGPWTDVWGLALAAVESMSGKPAIDGDHTAMIGTAVDEKRRPSPRSEGVHVSDAVEEVFLKALSVDPRGRYHDVGQFWDDLEAALGLPPSRNIYSGFSPQPYRDPRSDGFPTSLEERVEAAVVHRPVPSLRLAGSNPMSSTQKLAQTLDEPLLLGEISAPFEGEKPPSSDKRSGEPDTRAKMQALGARPSRVEKRPAGPRHTDLPALASLRGRDREPVDEATPTSPHVQQSRSGHPESLRTLASADQILDPARPPSEPPPLSLPPAPLSDRAPISSPPITPAPVTPAPISPAPVSAPPSRRPPMTGPQARIDLAVSPDEARRGPNSYRPPPSVPSGGLSRNSTMVAAVAPPPASMTMASRAPSHRSVPGLALGPELETAESRRSTLFRALRIPVGVMAAGFVLAFANYINASLAGGTWSIGPVPVNWIAGLLVVVGTGVLLLRLFWQMEE